MHQGGDTPKLYGLMAEFDSAGAIVAAARQAREAGYRKLEKFGHAEAAILLEEVVGVLLAEKFPGVRDDALDFIVAQREHVLPHVAQLGLRIGVVELMKQLV